jgi:NAD-dependent SIR2 family protein deacetylase
MIAAAPPAAGPAAQADALDKTPVQSPVQSRVQPHGQPLVQSLVQFVRAHPRLQVLTGAGVSTGSGIPDYRDSEGAWKRKPPVSHQDFLSDPGTRRRYWARSLLGWPQMASATPNAAHAALARLEQAGRVRQLVTQNVDGLHGRAGSKQMLELHGSIHKVDCMDCKAGYPRAAVQAGLAASNPRFAALQGAAAPDGDADLEADTFDDFVIPVCAACSGLLKPGVVFFGDNVPRARLDSAWEGLEQSDALLVVGSSLMVYSGYRFCLKAAELGKPVAAINFGRTRADGLFALKVESACGPALQSLLDQLE